MIKIFITGPPGVGKTTVINRLFETLKLYGYNPGGFITYEIREAGKRVGFIIKSLANNKEGILAHIKFKNGYPIGKYKVDIKTLEDIGVEALKEAVEKEDIDIILVDEIGPMEMASPKFKDAVELVLNSEKPAVLTVHYRISTNLNRLFSTDKETKLYMITRDNREAIPFVIWRELKSRGLLGDRR